MVYPDSLVGPITLTFHPAGSGPQLPNPPCRQYDAMALGGEAWKPGVLTRLPVASVGKITCCRLTGTAVRAAWRQGEDRWASP
jgi:hypothetical protein